MGGVVTNTFEMESLCKDLNLTSKDFYKICKYKNSHPELSARDIGKTFGMANTTIQKYLQNHFFSV